MERGGPPDDDARRLASAGIPEPADPARGLFADGSWLRRISGEPVLLFGGGRALLLEIAHPLIAAGVAEHSRFESDPFGRLQRTLDAMSKLAFGSRDDALAAARFVERSHARVRGVLPERVGRFAEGTPYDGRDPELVRWIWATLVDTSLVVYERFVAPLDATARDAFYADQCRLARLLGVPAELLPADAAAFGRYLDAMHEGTLAVGAQARRIARAVLQPRGGLPSAGLVRAVTSALLPPALREAFGLRWDEARAQRFDAVVSSVRRLREERAEPPPSGRRAGDLR